MSTLGDAVSGIRRLMLMDNEVERIKLTLAKAEANIADHDRRLIRIESFIEFGQRMLPPR